MVKKQRKKKEEEEEVNESRDKQIAKQIVEKKIKLKPGVTPLKAGQIITSDQFAAPPVSKLIESLAKFLWFKYDRTRLTNDWNRETPQRQLQWHVDAQTVRDLVDEYYEE